VFSFEIPNKNQERLLLYLHDEVNDRYIRLDDFFVGSDFGTPQIKFGDNSIEYIGKNVVHELKSPIPANLHP
jgi:hypothetical protein